MLSQRAKHTALSIVLRVQSRVAEWKNAFLSDTSVSLTVKSGAELVTRYYKNTLNYVYCTFLYLSAAIEHQNNLRTKKKPDDTSVAIIPPRKEVITTIATLAGLRPEEVPSLALAMETPVQVIVEWSHDFSLSPHIPNLWPGFFGSLKTSVVLTVVSCLMIRDQRHLRFLAQVFIIIVLIRSSGVRDWFDWILE